MDKYFLNDGVGGKAGPYNLEELQLQHITPETLIWYEGLEDWTTAGQVEELKPLFAVPDPIVEEAPVVVAPVVEVVKPVEPVTVTPTVTTAAATTAAATTTVAAATPPPPKKETTIKTPAPAGKKSTAWVSWLLTLLVLGGAGYFVYQDLEKNKDKTAGISKSGPVVDTTNKNPEVYVSETSDPDTTSVNTTTNPTTATEPVTATTTTPATTTTTTATDPKVAAAKKAEEDKKKKAAADAKKAEEDKKKKAEAAAMAKAARELDQRNHWSRYITFGPLNYNTKGEGIDPFDVPVYNGTDYQLDKVTVRIEYLKKKETKIYKTENITIYNIPARTTLNGKAPESKKGEKVNVYITSVSSKALHFCYPQNGGNPADPYFCN